MQFDERGAPHELPGTKTTLLTEMRTYDLIHRKRSPCGRRAGLGSVETLPRVIPGHHHPERPAVPTASLRGATRDARGVSGSARPGPVGSGRTIHPVVPQEPEHLLPRMPAPRARKDRRRLRACPERTRHRPFTSMTNQFNLLRLATDANLKFPDRLRRQTRPTGPDCTSSSIPGYFWVSARSERARSVQAMGAVRIPS